MQLTLAYEHPHANSFTLHAADASLGSLNADQALSCGDISRVFKQHTAKLKPCGILHTDALSPAVFSSAYSAAFGEKTSLSRATLLHLLCMDNFPKGQTVTVNLEPCDMLLTINATSGAIKKGVYINLDLLQKLSLAREAIESLTGIVQNLFTPNRHRSIGNQTAAIPIYAISIKAGKEVVLNTNTSDLVQQILRLLAPTPSSLAASVASTTDSSPSDAGSYEQVTDWQEIPDSYSAPSYSEGQSTSLNCSG